MEFVIPIHPEDLEQRRADRFCAEAVLEVGDATDVDALLDALAERLLDDAGRIQDAVLSHDVFDVLYSLVKCVRARARAGAGCAEGGGGGPVRAPAGSPAARRGRLSVLMDARACDGWMDARRCVALASPPSSYAPRRPPPPPPKHRRAWSILGSSAKQRIIELLCSAVQELLAVVGGTSHQAQDKFADPRDAQRAAARLRSAFKALLYMFAVTVQVAEKTFAPKPEALGGGGGKGRKVRRGAGRAGPGTARARSRRCSPSLPTRYPRPTL